MNRQADWSKIPAHERIVLLPHCLRPSSGCPGQMTPKGLVCPTDCPRASCPIRRLREEAQRLGYKGVYVAPGGSLALRVIKEVQPQGVVAIACLKELLEGTEAVANLSETPPAVLTLPLSRDGCVDTEVDMEKALALLHTGLEASALALAEGGG